MANPWKFETIYNVYLMDQQHLPIHRIEGRFVAGCGQVVMPNGNEERVTFICPIPGFEYFKNQRTCICMLIAFKYVFSVCVSHNFHDL